MSIELPPRALYDVFIRVGPVIQQTVPTVGQFRVTFRSPLTAMPTSIASSGVDKPFSSDKLAEEIDDDMLGPSYPLAGADALLHAADTVPIPRLCRYSHSSFAPMWTNVGIHASIIFRAGAVRPQPPSFTQHLRRQPCSSVNPLILNLRYFQRNLHLSSRRASQLQIGRPEEGVTQQGLHGTR